MGAGSHPKGWKNNIFLNLERGMKVGRLLSIILDCVMSELQFDSSYCMMIFEEEASMGFVLECECFTIFHYSLLYFL